MKQHQEEPGSRTKLRADSGPSGTQEESSEARGLSRTMRDPARTKRNASPKTKSRANGRGGESSSLIEPPNEAKTNGKENGSDKSERESAASDDATGATHAGDVAPSSAAACTGRDACAEVAAPRSRSSAIRDEASGIDDDRRPRASGDSRKTKRTLAAKEKEQPKEYPPGTEEPLPLDAPGFVEQMHERVNLYEVYKDLLTSGDFKVKQRATEFLMEMKYGKGSAASEEQTPRIDFGDLPRPKR